MHDVVIPVLVDIAVVMSFQTDIICRLGIFQYFNGQFIRNSHIYRDMLCE